MVVKNSEEKAFLQKRVKSPKETEKIASEFYKKLNWGDLVAFYGDLGSGKTYFIKTLCKKLKTIEEAKMSPANLSKARTETNPVQEQTNCAAASITEAEASAFQPHEENDSTIALTQSPKAVGLFP